VLGFDVAIEIQEVGFTQIPVIPPKAFFELEDCPGLPHSRMILQARIRKSITPIAIVGDGNPE
jgi:hypothetical protein